MGTDFLFTIRLRMQMNGDTAQDLQEQDTECRVLRLQYLYC